MKVLKKNSAGDEVKIVQYLIGYTTKLGIFTSGLESKIIALQKEYGLIPDGIVGNDTYCAIAEKSPILKKKKGKTKFALILLAIILVAGVIVGLITKSDTEAFNMTYFLLIVGIGAGLVVLYFLTKALKNMYDKSFCYLKVLLSTQLFQLLQNLHHFLSFQSAHS